MDINEWIDVPLWKAIVRHGTSTLAAVLVYAGVERVTGALVHGDLVNKITTVAGVVTILGVSLILLYNLCVEMFRRRAKLNGPNALLIAL